MTLPPEPDPRPSPPPPRVPAADPAGRLLAAMLDVADATAGERELVETGGRTG
jgi:hypothetical protein